MKIIKMKTIKLLTLFLLFAGFIQTTAAQNSEVPNGIITALKSGDASKLSSYFNDNVQLLVGNKNDIYSKQQSVGIIADFFKRNNVTNFEIIHQGTKEAASFIIGTLYTSGGKYRVSILTRKSGATSVIQQLRIESNND
ncbi:conserved exported hypothetical protein [uncultured Paludibacter sp.]|nr:conserved exported hypothetical protein [uncultured Paludibacter sp.]